MSLAAAATAAGALLSGGTSLFGSIINKRSVEETNALNERLQREAWAREDTAVQRRRADLEAAGINPVMASGQAATSMPAVKLEAPRFEGNFAKDAMESALGGAMMGAQLDNMRKQNELLQVEIEKGKVDKLNSLTHGERMSIENQHLEDMLGGQVEHTRLSNELLEQQKELASLGVTEKGFTNMMLEVEKEFQRQGIKLDLQNKEVQNMIATEALNESKRNNDLRSWFGRSSDAPMPIQVAEVLATSMKRGIELGVYNLKRLGTLGKSILNYRPQFGK